MAVAAVGCACGAFAGAASAHGGRGGGRGPGPGYGPDHASTLDLYYVPSANIEFFDGDDDGDGFGGKAAFRISRGVFLTGEYQQNTYDEQDRDLDQFRLGMAFGPGAGNGEGLYGRVQYVNYDLERPEGSLGPDPKEQDGIAGHVGFTLPLSPQFRLFGEVGYLSTDDFDGPEFVGGAILQVAPNLGIYGDYRATRLEDDSEDPVDLDDVRVGVRFTF
ncbi:MAG TPA: hypothetical protein VJM11_03405 [Nevskiaceae bacterium]|nr:hypothetical protein [Nevskiaceae bacterium]